MINSIEVLHAQYSMVQIICGGKFLRREVYFVYYRMNYQFSHIPYKMKYWRGVNFLAIGDFWIKSPIFNPPIIFLHRYMYACDIRQYLIRQKRVLHYFAKYYSRQYFVLYSTLIIQSVVHTMKP